MEPGLALTGKPHFWRIFWADSQRLSVHRVGRQGSRFSASRHRRRHVTGTHGLSRLRVWLRCGRRALGSRTDPKREGSLIAMTIELPLWLQNLEYSARLDRLVIERVARGAEQVYDGLVVAQDGVGSFNVDVSGGGGVIQGDDSANQGMYMVKSTTTVTIPVPPSPASGSRTDTVIVRVNDSQAGGLTLPADQAVFDVIEGTVLPDTAISLATIARTFDESAILDAAITDTRTLLPETELVNTDGDPGVTAYSGSVDPDVSYMLAAGDIWITSDPFIWDGAGWVTPPGYLGWDITTATYASTKDVSAQDTNPNSVAFSPDGTKMFVVGPNTESVYRHDLSTAWDITTASYVSSKDVGAQDFNPNSVAFSPDGTKMFVLGLDETRVYRYDLGTAWDITTASYVSLKSVYSQDTLPTGVAFSGDGTKMFVAGIDNDSVYRYDLSTAWDITTATYVSTKDVSAQDRPNSVAFSGGGTKMFVAGATNASVYRYDLGTAWDITTASYTSTKSVAAQDANPSSVAFSVDGTKMFVLGLTNDSVYRYDLSKPEAASEYLAPETETGTTYTLVLADGGRLKIFSDAALVTVTIPANVAEALPDGWSTLLQSTGADGLTLTTTSLTLNGSSPNKTIAQNEGMFLIKSATDTWTILGGTAA